MLRRRLVGRSRPGAGRALAGGRGSVERKRIGDNHAVIAQRRLGAGVAIGNIRRHLFGRAKQRIAVAAAAAGGDDQAVAGSPLHMGELGRQRLR